MGQCADADHFYHVGDGLGHRPLRVQLHGAELDSTQEIDMRCIDTMAMFLFYALVVDAAIEGAGLDPSHVFGRRRFSGHAVHGARKTLLHLKPRTGHFRHSRAVVLARLAATAAQARSGTDCGVGCTS